MKNWLLGSVFLTLSFQALSQDTTRTTLHLVGDSTMSDKPNLAYPERGWGQLLPSYMSAELELRIMQPMVVVLVVLLTRGAGEWFYLNLTKVIMYWCSLATMIRKRPTLNVMLL